MSSNIYAELCTPQAITEMLTRAAPKAVRTMTTLAEVRAFAKVAEVNNDIGSALRELTIDICPITLNDPSARAVYVPTMRSALRLCPNLTDLTLTLPKTTPPAIFFQVIFAGLRFFKTNLPHRALFVFLGQNVSIRDLIVGPCHEQVGPCPLIVRDLSHVTSLECHAPCVDAVAHAGLLHLLVDNPAASCYIFPKLRNVAPMTGLYCLTLDFLPDDFEILGTIALIAPTVRKLKLLERSGSARRRTSTRRAFNDHLSWYRGLRKLGMLEELALRTTAPLVTRAGDLELERRLISGWVQGVRSQRRTSTTSRAHPSLYHVRIWYGSTVATSTITKWFNDGGEWSRLNEPARGLRYTDTDF